MATTKEKPFYRRLATEFSIIFIGVLLALVADDFRETHSERREARQSLFLVLADLNADSTDFASVRASAENHTAAAAWLIERWNLAEVPLDSLEMALFSFGSRNTLQLSSSAFEGLQNSNRLRLLRNSEIQEGILRYYQFRQKVISDFYDEVSERRKVLLYERLPPHVEHPGGREPGRMWPASENRIKLRTPWPTITNDPLLHSDIVIYGRFSDFLSQTMLGGEEETGTLMSLIRAELGPQ